MKKTTWTVFFLLVVVCLANDASAQNFIDIGAATPTPGLNDLAQLSTNGNTAANTATGRPDGLNYYTDNSAPAGQTFTTASNTTGLTSLAIRTADLHSGGGYGIPATTPTYYLRLYSVAGGNATLITTLTATNPGFVDGDWLSWTNLVVPLTPNSTYAYSFGRQPSSGGWCALAVASGNRYAGGEIALIPTAGGTMTFGASHGYDAVFDLGLTTNVMVVLTDIGTATPTPGPKDISQLSTNGNTTYPDGLNFYSNNSNPAGQTFTNGPGATNLISLAIRTAGLGNGGGYGTPSTITNYYLRLYSVAGSTATLIQSYTNLNPGFTDGEWLKWNNLSVPLAANSTYAFSVSVLPGGSSSWVAFAVAGGNRYTGGQIALIPIGGGAMTFGGSHNYDAVFDLGMFADAPTANTPIVAPKNTVYVGQPLTLTENAVGTGTLFYQWRTDGGGGGSLTNIPGVTGTNMAVMASSTGTFKYAVLVTNSYGGMTSSVVAVTVLPPTSVMVNVSNQMATMPLHGLGICTATYDGVLIDSRVAPMLNAAGIKAVRYPGGSYADIFNWQTTTGNGGAYVDANDSFTNFMNVVVNPGGAQAIITVNYGSNPANDAGGDTNVAAAWVDFANNTKHWGIKYWEIGNEIGGNGYYWDPGWEYDLHYTNYDGTRAGQPALSPAAYGSNSVQFITAMKAKDSTIKCGVGYDPFTPSYNTAVLGQTGTNADFVIIHWYPGSDTASMLAASTGIPAIVNTTRTQLTNVVGAAHAARMEIAVTETGAGNATGSPIALYAADNYLTWIENGIFNVDYQELHSYPAVFLQSNQQAAPGYYGALLSHLLADVGDTFLKTTSGDSALRVHATTRQDGKTGVMLVNTDPLIAIAATVNISGMSLASSGIRYQFGPTNFIGANLYPDFPMSSNVVSGLGNVFTILVPAYTVIDLLIPPAATNTAPVLAAISNRTVNVGQTVAFTASATDTDAPPQTLTFTLLAGTTNTTLNTNSGAFSWRPLVTQAKTTNTFALKVADSGSPSLSATQSFTVMVNLLAQPGVSAAGLSNGWIGLHVSGVTGPDYAVQGSTNLADWNTLFITNSPAMPFSWTATSPATLPAQFYRIKAGPPLP